MRVIASGPVEVAVRTEEHAASVVTALLALLVVAQEDLLAFEVEHVVLNREPRDGLTIKADGRVEAVDPAVLAELGVEGKTQEAILLLQKDLELADDLHLLRLEVDGLEQAAVFVEVEPTVWSHLGRHRLGDVTQEFLDLEAHVLGGSGRRGERGNEGSEG